MKKNEAILQATIDIVCDELEAELADMVGDPEYAGWLGIIADMFTWDDLVEFLARGTVKKMRIATEWKAANE